MILEDKFLKKIEEIKENISKINDPLEMVRFLDECDSFADGKKSAHEQRFSVVRRTGSLIGGMTG